jgi:methanogenic corrinoid protein MtbC1
MFGASSQPAVSGHPSVARRPGPSQYVMESPPTPRSSERQARQERLERTIENELVPRMLTSHQVGAIPPSLATAVGRELSERDVDGFVAAVRSPEDAKAAEFIRGILAEGATIEAVYLDLLAPSARQLGVLWENDDCDFVEVTVSLGRMQRALRDLSQLFLADAVHGAPVGSALLTCTPGEQHTLGVIMVGEFLLRDAWRVSVGAPWSEHDLLTLVRTEWFDVIGFSVGAADRLPGLKRDIQQLTAASRNPHVQIMVGGPVFSEHPEAVEDVGANALAGDAREAPQVARLLLAAARRAMADAPPEAVTEHEQFRDAI